MINKKFADKEYQSVYMREVNFIISQGINPSFMKIIECTKIFKFTKTPELFVC